MSNLEFRVDQNALDVIKNTQLTTNFEDVKQALTEFVAPYTKLIVSEDEIKSAKEDRARVNAVAKSIDSYRKQVKSYYTEPLKAFEDKCKELVAICATGTKNIDEQVQSYEEKRKEEKRFLLQEYYDNAEKKHPDYMTFEYVLPDKWDLKGTSLDSCKFQMDTAIMRTDKEVDSIIALKSEWEFSLLDKYKESHDILEVLALHERLTMTKQSEEKRRKELIDATQPIEVSDPDWDATPEPLPFTEEYEPESTYKVTFNAWCTYPQVQAIKDYLKSIGIYSELVDTVEIKVPHSGD